VRTKIKENQKLQLLGYAFLHQYCAFRTILSQVYKSVSLCAIHLKSDNSTVPSTMFDPHSVSSINKGRDKSEKK
tara:strand:+ start:53 stop:274 length:222 start_codon:yes stop_codon:yes gene_type:complete